MDDFDLDYLVGPESNQTKIGTRKNNHRAFEDDQYANGTNQFAKKRKVKRAANSMNNRDTNFDKLQR